MIDSDAYETAERDRAKLDALFGEVQTLAQLTLAVTSATGTAKPYRLFSHVALAEERERNKRLAAEFGTVASAELYLRAFAAKHLALFGRLEVANALDHPAVALACARVMRKQEGTP